MLDQRLKQPRPMLLDGGMGQELIQRGIVDEDSCLWSTNALMTNPDSIVAIHRDYIEAGADIITTNTYTTTRERLGREGFADRFKELNNLAGELACTARDQSKSNFQLKPKIYIAGCLPPLWGSYRPELVGTAEQAEQLYNEFAENLDPWVDFYLAETLSTAQEAIGAAKAIAGFNKPLMVAWTLRDDTSVTARNGHAIRQVIQATQGVNIQAWLLNCSIPESITAALPELIDLADGQQPIGGYANGFVPIPDGWRYTEPGSLPATRKLTPEEYLQYVIGWIDTGANIVGGCCEIGPKHIQAITQYLDQKYPYP